MYSAIGGAWCRAGVCVCLCTLVPTKAVLVVSHCFAVSGTSAQDLNLTCELAASHEHCDVRDSDSTATAVYGMFLFGVYVCQCSVVVESTEFI